MLYAVRASMWLSIVLALSYVSAALAELPVQYLLADPPIAKISPVSLPQEWETLGPFPSGTRELGHDPLSPYGGFAKLPYSETDRFPSDLAEGGYVYWKKITTSEDGTVRISYPDIHWESIRATFGWAALQHSAYLRGTLNVPQAGVYLVEFTGVVSWMIDDRPFVGNVYHYDHAACSAVYLSEGSHILYVYGSLDVRVSGGYIPPEIHFGATFTLADVSQNAGLVHFPNDAIMPDIIGNALVSPFASVTLLNTNIQKHGPTGSRHAPEHDEPGWVQVLSAAASMADGTKLNLSIPVHFSIKLAPGQIMPVPLNLTLENIPAENPVHINIQLECAVLDDNRRFTLSLGPFELQRRTWGDTYKITFSDYDHSIHYAMAKPPKGECSTAAKDCAIILALHGAGVEASSNIWTDAFQRQDHAWILYPTGRTSWGYDWHGPSFRNVEYALDALHLLPGVPEELKDRLSVDRNKLIYSGHSNGGQGAWWLASHYPDRALAALPASAYVKIQLYAPYYMRVGNTYADPLLRAIMEASIGENDIDLYASNLAGLPVLARHGAADDNVSPVHSRRLIRLVNEWNRNAESSSLSEIPAQGHWFTGIMTDDVTQAFLDQYLSVDEMPPLPDAFTVTTLNPASIGTKGGIRILQLDVPFRLATIRVHRTADQWVLNTSNVRRFGFIRDGRQKNIPRWSVDGTEFNKPPLVSGISYLKLPNGTWKEENDLLWFSQERHPSTYGPISATFNHPFIIVVPSNSTNNTMYREAAQQIANNWYMFSRGVTQIVRDVDVLDGIAARYNLIILGGPADNAYTKRREKEGASTMVTFLPSGGFQISDHSYEQPGTGILFLAPSAIRTRITAFIAGVDPDGFARALWTLPFRTGVEVPDYLVVGDEYGDPQTGWAAGDGAPYGGAGTKGVGGVLAAGYWNNTWNWDPRCGYLK
ncbi:hypothetical protein BC832DRAFT_562686 [Gaertneriomyces semiglobifer]|nr:hypothetical protein BC832DRAFT_562686 [Gaertneriomyces semiglobifer]